MPAPLEISFIEFLRIFKDNKASKSESRFCFILGAGASVSSDIESGASLAKKWIKTIEEDITDVEFKEWISEAGIKQESPELHYPEIYQKRFQHNRKSGHEALMCAMSDKEPSVGYPFFAQLLVSTTHNIVITTNFDSLLESSIYRYTDSQPLVIGHENLAHFLNSSTKRPIIAKIHRDLLLDPKNDTEGTSSLPSEWQKPLKQILETTHIIVVGYGGNDGSLMDFLATLDNRNGIYWCKRESSAEVLPEKVTDVLKQDSDRIVNIPDFDGLMIELAAIFGCATLLDKKEINKSHIIEKARERAEKFQKQIDDYADANKASSSPQSTIQNLVSDWYDYQKQVHATEDNNEKDSIYQQGIKDTSHPSLMGNYAIFLESVKKDYDAAEKHYLKALEIEPDHANVNGNYATLLCGIKKDYDAAEKYYLKALEIEPDHANHNGNYASFLCDIKKDYDTAEKHYLKALEIEPDHTNNIGNYATFLCGVKKDYDAAEKYYLKALEVAPDHASHNGNYAGFLFSIGNDKSAEKYLQRSWDNVDSRTDKAQVLELYFYEYAHVASKRKKAETELLKLLELGVNSLGFDLSQNVDRAIKSGHPSPDELRSYAQRISGI